MLAADRRAIKAASDRQLARTRPHALTAAQLDRDAGPPADQAITAARETFCAGETAGRGKAATPLIGGVARPEWHRPPSGAAS